MRTDSAAVLESVTAISDFYGANTVEARRSLRHDLELQNLQLAKKFLAEFDIIKERIERVGASHALPDFCTMRYFLSYLLYTCPEFSIRIHFAFQGFLPTLLLYHHITHACQHHLANAWKYLTFFISPAFFLG
jgi:hypothetical protein